MKKFVKAVLITTILSIFTKLLGLVLKIYISREIGATSLGVYQIALSAFFLLCSLVTSGIPLIVSRKVAKNPSSEPQIVGSGVIICLGISLFVCAILTIFPSIFTTLWGQKQSLICLYVLLPAVIFTALYVPFRGSFWGKKKFFTLGAVELAEQIIRAICCVIIFNIHISLSGEIKVSLTYSVACLLSTIIALVIFFKQGNKFSLSASQIPPLLKESTPIAIVRIGTSIVSLLISIILPASLAKTGLTLDQAISQFGIVSGMVLPILTIPGTLISSIAVALIPEISTSSNKQIERQINQCISYSIIISLILFPLFFILGDKIGLWLFNNKLSGNLLKIGSFLLLPLGISQITTSILNALNKEKTGLFISIATSSLLIISLLIFPRFFGIYAMVIGFFIMSTASSILNLLTIKKYLTKEPLIVLLKNLIFCIPACLLGYFVDGICMKTTSNVILSIIVSGGVSLCSLCALLLAFNMIDLNALLPWKRNATN